MSKIVNLVSNKKDHSTNSDICPECAVCLLARIHEIHQMDFWWDSSEYYREVYAVLEDIFAGVNDDSAD